MKEAVKGDGRKAQWYYSKENRGEGCESMGNEGQVRVRGDTG